MRHAVRAALLVALGAGVGAAACSAPDAGDGRLSTVIAEGLRADDDRGELTFTEEEASCVADRVLDQLGEERLRDLGADRTPLDELPLDDDERRVVFLAVDGCVDLVTQVAGFLAEDAALPEEVARCVAERYAASGELQDALFGSAIDPELGARIDAVLDAALADCAGTAPA